MISQDDYTFPRDRQAQDAPGIPNPTDPKPWILATFRRDGAPPLRDERVTRQEFAFDEPSEL